MPPAVAETESANQHSGKLESELGVEWGPRAPSRFREQSDPRFPDSSKARAGIRGATSVQMARGLHGKTNRRSSLP